MFSNPYNRQVERYCVFWVIKEEFTCYLCSANNFHPYMIEFSRVKNERAEYIQFDILNYLSESLLPPSAFHSPFAFD